MAEPTIIKYSKCYIYKPRLNFVKNNPFITKTMYHMRILDEQASDSKN